MSALVLLNLLIVLRKSEKCEACLALHRFFHSKFNKFNYTGARMLDFIHHMTLKFLKNGSFGVKTILPSSLQRYNRRHYVTLPKISK